MNVYKVRCTESGLFYSGRRKREAAWSGEGKVYVRQGNAERMCDVLPATELVTYNCYEAGADTPMFPEADSEVTK